MNISNQTLEPPLGSKDVGDALGGIGGKFGFQQ